jgi:hypothetical protein
MDEVTIADQDIARICVDDRRGDGVALDPEGIAGLAELAQQTVEVLRV